MTDFSHFFYDYIASFHLHYVSLSFTVAYPQPLSSLTSLSHYILSIFRTASLLNCVHLLLFTDVFISLSLPPPVYPFLFPTFPPSILYHANPSVSFSLSPTPHSLILGFICLSLAHLRSVYPAWFYLHQNAGTRTGKYGSLS